MYLKNGKVKVELALAKGKKLYDKRQDMAKKRCTKTYRKRNVRKILIFNMIEKL